MNDTYTNIREYLSNRPEDIAKLYDNALDRVMLNHPYSNIHDLLTALYSEAFTDGVEAGLKMIIDMKADAPGRRLP